VLAILAAGALAATGFVIVPRSLEALAWRQAADDPPALARLGLRQALTPVRVTAEIDAALAGNDGDLGASFVALADREGVTVDPSQRTRVTAALDASQAPAQMARDFAQGFATGKAAALPGYAGIIAGDLTAYGDIRDLWREGAKLWTGEPHDELVLGLAAVGLALTGMTVATIGSALPARGGVTLVKAARKSGRLSPTLAASTTHILHEAVDLKALQGAVRSAARFDVSGAREGVRAAVRPAALGRLRGIADNSLVFYRRAGARATQDALGLAHDAGEVRKAARLAEHYGSSTRAALKVLGRGALVLVGSLMTLAGWVLTGLVWLWATLLGVAALTRWLTRWLWPRRPARTRFSMIL
jgi:hypothetical protein